MSDTPEKPDFGPPPSKPVPPPPVKPTPEVKLEPAQTAPSKPASTAPTPEPAPKSAQTQAKRSTPSPAASIQLDHASKDEGVSSAGLVVDVIAALVAITFTILIFLDVKSFL